MSTLHILYYTVYYTLAYVVHNVFTVTHRIMQLWYLNMYVYTAAHSMMYHIAYCGIIVCIPLPLLVKVTMNGKTEVSCIAIVFRFA